MPPLSADLRCKSPAGQLCPSIAKWAYTIICRRQWMRSSRARIASSTKSSNRCAHTILSNRRPLSLGPMAQQWRPCSPAAGWEKGQVENQVKVSRGRHFAPRLKVANYDELNEILYEQVIEHAKVARHPEFKDRMIYDVFPEEQNALVPCQGSFNGFHETTVAVSKTCLVNSERNRYSICVTAAGKPVQLRATATKVTLLQNEQIAGEHDRVFGRDKTIYDPWHYVPIPERKPGAIRPSRQIAAQSPAGQ